MTDDTLHDRVLAYLNAPFPTPEEIEAAQAAHRARREAEAAKRQEGERRRNAALIERARTMARESIATRPWAWARAELIDEAERLLAREDLSVGAAMRLGELAANAAVNVNRCLQRIATPHEPELALARDPAVRAAAAEALALVTARDQDRAQDKNGVGWSKTASLTGHVLTGLGELSETHATHAIRILRLHRGQVPRALMARVLGAPAPAPVEAAPAPEAPAVAVPRRPMVRWLGSKWRMAPWVIEHLPPHELYVEPYGGSASVLMRKPRSPVEVLGDLDDELLNLYAVIRDPVAAGRLYLVCTFTPFSDAEFRLAMRRLPADADPVERARRMIVRHAMQLSPDVRGETQGTGFRRYTGSARRVAAADWEAFPEALADMTARLGRVVIERLPAVETIRKHDRPGALFYVDPPYVHATRQEVRKGYAHEMTDGQHRELLDCLLGLEGMAVVSGYASPLYDEALAGWRRVTREVTDHARQRREEVLWISPAAVAATGRGARPARPARRRAAEVPGQLGLGL